MTYVINLTIAANRKKTLRLERMAMLWGSLHVAVVTHNNMAYTLHLERIFKFKFFRFKLKTGLGNKVIRWLVLPPHSKVSGII